MSAAPAAVGRPPAAAAQQPATPSHPVRALTRHNLRLMLGDPGPIIIYLAIPVLSMLVMRPTQQTILRDEGFPGANGSEQVVPGFLVMFLFLWTITIGRAFFVEHGWGTWERLRASRVNIGQVLIGKLVPGFLLIMAQIVLTMVLGWLLFGLHSKGPILVLVLVAVPLATCVLALTAMLVAVSGTYAQLEAGGNMFMIVFAAVGGALTPVAVLPSTVQDIAPALPSYWALQPARDVILKGDGISAVLGPAAVLTLFTLLFGIIAIARFNSAESKSIEI
ncbi:MAG: type transport system permease protein [Thermoleophilaceae bacterium]|jgi:ABC-2 type transport system permease protein|nr:type transport system permease protein [Thermoleophilaceae bacterium]